MAGHDSDGKLTAAARLAGLGYWRVEADDNRVSWSEETCRVLGLPLTERSRPWPEFLEIVLPEDRPLLEDCVARVARGGPEYPVVFRLMRPEGPVCYVESTGEAVHDGSGRTVRVVGAIHDVTERNRAGEVLRAHQERFQLALQATGLAPWDWNLATNEVEFWPEWKRQIGYEPEEIPNRYEEWERRLHPDDRERVLAALGDYLEGRAPEYALEFRLRHKNGSYRCIYTRGLLLRDVTGRATHLIGCHLDITERRDLEAQYRESQKLEAVGQLAGGVAHDFNNLLVVVDGYAAGIAMDLAADHPAQPDLAEIREAARRAAEMTHQLLAFSRRQVLQPQVLDPNEVVRQMRQLLARVVGADITLRLNLSAASRVRADRGQLERVLMNLASNARDAMPHGGHLTITTQDVDLEAGPHMMVTVGDTGIGMDDLTRAHLFEPYFTTKPAGRGTGLGLATVYGIVKQSGGTISVQSQPHQGTTFEICLPAAGGPPLRD